MNNVSLVGRITYEPELKYSTTGKPYLRFSIAIDKKLSKEKREEFIKNEIAVTDFPRVVIWGKHAETCNKYIGKGSLIGVTGSVSTDSYEKLDGSKAYKMEILARNIKFLDTRKTGEESKVYNDIEVNDDIPF